MSNSALYSCIGCGLRIGEQLSSTNEPPSCMILDALSKSNDPPPPLEYDHLKQRYRETQSRVTSLSSQISRLGNSIKVLLAEQKKLKERLVAWKGLLHPIRRLPDDVLAYIFQTCVELDFDYLLGIDSDDSDRYPGMLDTGRSPWVLGQVCRRWRSLTLSLPQLWTYFDIGWKYTDEDTMYGTCFEPLLALQLQRCRDLPLTVSYYGEGLDGQYASKQRLLMVLCSRSFQWANATIRGDTAGLNHLLPYRGLFPYLRQLHLYLEEDRWNDEDEEAYVFQDTPSLQQVTIAGDHGTFTSTSAQLPWTRITHYTSKECDEIQYKLLNNVHFRLLPKMPNLRVCGLDCVDAMTGVDDPIEAPRASLRLSFLHTLVLTCHEIEDSEPSSIGQLLDWLVLPNLQCLKLLDGFRTPDSLLGLLQRSSCTLLELEIIDARLGGPQLNLVIGFHKLQDLHTLVIGKYKDHMSASISDASLKRLKLVWSGKHKSIILPKLQHLVLHGRKRWTDEVLVDVAASRRDLTAFGISAGSVARLESLVIHDAVSEGEAALVSQVAQDRLQVLQAGGLLFECRL
ncbi:hypothetical protein Moror_9438 [Moniliophthora roreri MCA 2997]|uniref:Uncharacterized protein n=1 Tax=Moniliophthora roreri (strain MCA 2997) TaxID=1381753 RepID=V2Y2Y5_MONRO|nr:hypothetical protein Moror_9438 [Moniliophthora roreri MCA 2997]